MIKCCTLIERINYLKKKSPVESPTVTTCLRRGRTGPKQWAKAFVSKGENERSCHQCLFEENVKKTKMEKVKGLRIFENKGSRVIYARGRY